MAIEQCEEAATSLHALVNDLSYQVKRKGTRGKLKAVLQKDDLTRHEKRLSQALDILKLAHQMYGMARQEYLIALQEAQPAVIVTQLLEQLSSSPFQITVAQLFAPTYQPGSSSQLDSTNSNSVAGNHSTNTQHRPLCHDEGSERATANSSSRSPSASGESNSYSSQLYQLSLPSWLSLKTIKLVMDRSQWGWLYPFRNFTRYSIDSAMYDLVWKTIQKGSLQEFRKLTEGGTVSIYDRFYIPPMNDPSDWLRENSMITMAMRSSSWDIFNYLTTHNVEFHGFAYVKPWDSTSESFHEIQKALLHYADNTTFLGACIARYNGDYQGFVSLIRSLRSADDLFDDSASSTSRRAHIALSIVGGSIMSQTDSTAYIVRFLLSRDDDDDNTIILKDGLRLPPEPGVPENTVSLLIFQLAVALMVSVLVFPDYYVLGWSELLQDVLHSILLLESPNSSSSSSSSAADHRDEKWSLAQHHHQHQQIFEALPLSKMVAQLHYYVPWPISPVAWEAAAQVLLQALFTCSVDLIEYGAHQKNSRLETLSEEESQQQQQQQPSRRRPWRWIDALIHDVQIVGLAYGPRAQDWTIWVSEPTDVFAGDFWWLVEPEPQQHVPGAWVEEIE